MDASISMLGREAAVYTDFLKRPKEKRFIEHHYYDALNCMLRKMYGTE